MLSGPVALLGFTCWNARWTSSSYVLSLWKSFSSADDLFKISWICLCFCEKSWQSKRLKNWFSSLTSPALFTEVIFCVLPFTYLLINFIPLHTHFFASVSSSLSFFRNASFFLLMPLTVFCDMYIVQRCNTDYSMIRLKLKLREKLSSNLMSLCSRINNI